MSQIQFPNLKTWAEVFPVTSRTKDGAPPPVAFDVTDWLSFKRKPPTVRVEIGPVCRFRAPSGYQTPGALWVGTTPEIAAFLRDRWVGTSDGSFEVVIRDDGTALIVAEYDQIIGGVWLALIDASTIPAEVTP